MNTNALQQAISIAGSQVALGKLINSPQSTIWSWLNRDKKVPAERCLAIQKATNGKITAKELRPDIFGTIE
jgi:DNA-binding transcriptional regulator YdaS (Cro superfamily)